MEEILLKCKCGEMKMYQNYIKGVPNRKHWFIVCNNCKISVEAKTKEKAIKLWNSIPYRKGQKMTREEYIEIMDKSNFMIDSANPYDMEIKEALEKQIPKKINVKNSIRYYCPSCDLYFDSRDWKSKYCGRCGQAIKW